MTEREKMTIGEVYDTSDTELQEGRTKAHNLCREYNAIPENDEKKRNEILNELLPNKKDGVYLQGPIYFDYGYNLILGKNFYANFNFTALDCSTITIGDDVLIGPNCSIVTPVHPLHYSERNIRKKPDGTMYDMEYAKPVVIGNNCWIASNVTIIGGVKIGDGCVIGAGSVVTKDIPSGYLAFGNPCKPIRKICEKDKSGI